MKREIAAFLSILLTTTVFMSARAQTRPAPTATPSPTPLARSTPAASPAGSPGAWDPLAEMERMQSDMNRFFARAMNEFGMNQNFLSLRNEPGFASSMDVRDKGDHYEVHAFLPGADIDNVKVTADSNNRLRVTATHSKHQTNTTKTAETSTSEWGEYDQLVTLPGPARTKDMRVDRQENEILVTIPKKK